MPQIQTPQGPINLPYDDQGGQQPQPQFDPSGPLPPGLPPELLESLMAGGPEAGPPAPPEAGPEAGGGEDGPTLLKSLLSQLDAYKRVERDEADLLVAEQIGTLIQKLLAKQQSESDDMMQGKVSPGALRRLGG